MKMIIWITLLIAAFLAATRYVLGFSIWNIGAAIDMSGGIGAKLACSGKYLSGLDDQEVIADLSSYSPIFNYLDVHFDAETKQTTASLFGLSPMSATYRGGLGCVLDIGDTNHLNNVTFTPQEMTVDDWPAGNGVTTINAELQSLLDELLKADNQAGKQTRAMLVVAGDQILAESYGEGFDKNTKLMGWSMGKSLTAIMLGRMEKLGLIELEETNLFKEWQNDARSEISVKHLLQMSSGLGFDETYAPGSDSTKMLFTAHSASDVALSGSPDHQPSRHFSYSSGTTNILMRLMHDKLGGTTQASLNFLHDKVLIPIGMHNTIFETDPSGVLVGSSYIYATGRDWARLGALMLNAGSFNGQQLLTPEFVADSAKPNTSDNDTRYGYQFWLNAGNQELRWETLPADAYAMMGNRKQVVMIIPSKNLVFVRLGWTSGMYSSEVNIKAVLDFMEQS